MEEAGNDTVNDSILGDEPLFEPFVYLVSTG